MKLLVFGASGRTGQHILRLAASRGISVAGFVRRAATLNARTDLEVIEGDVSDPIAVQSAVAGRDAVISTLGVSTPLKPDPAVCAGVGHIVAAMERLQVARLVYLSFIGVSASRSSAGPILRFVARIPLRHEIADHEEKERRVQASKLDWLIVRPPKFTDGPATGRTRAGVGLRATNLLPQLSRADVAAFLLEQVLQPSFHREAVHLLPMTT